MKSIEKGGRTLLWAGGLGVLAWPFLGTRWAGIFAVLLILSATVREAARRWFPAGIASYTVRRIPPYLRQGAIGLGIIVLIGIPFVLNNYYLDTLSLAALYAMLAVGLNVTVGFAGLLDLGYAAFYGIGAYAYAIASTHIGIPFWIGLPIGGLAAACAGILLGVVTLRLRGDYLAIVTLGFIQIAYLIFNNWESVTGGPNGIMRIPRPTLGGALRLTRPAHFYVLTLLLLVLTVVIVHRLVHSQIGRGWLAIREDETAAAAMGIDTTRMKILAFALGAGIAGTAGVVFAAKYAFISPESFSFQESVRILSMVVLGGMGSINGVILGAFLLTILPELLRDLSDYRMLIFGIILVAMMILRPQGLLGRRT